MKKKHYCFLLLLIFLSFQANAQVPTWPAEVNKTITKLQPQFKTTSTKFRKIPVEKSGIGGPVVEHCNKDLLPLIKEVFGKELFLLDFRNNKRFKIKLEVFATQERQSALTLQRGIATLSEIKLEEIKPKNQKLQQVDSTQNKSKELEQLTSLGCPQPLADKKPIILFVYGESLFVLATDQFQNAETFIKYAEAFEANLKKLQ